MKAKNNHTGAKGKTIHPAKDMPMVHAHAGGLDVGATRHTICVPEDAVPAGESPVREFGAFTSDLDKIVEWLRSCGVTTVAMESTGKYWIAPYEKLEAAGIVVVLCNPRHLKHVPGRKSDMLDCQWLQLLHSYGLIAGSFRPSDDVRRVRTLVRHRSNLVVQAAQAVQHMQSAFDDMNVHLHHAISDLDGNTGLRIVDAILAGERDPQKLVGLRDERCRKSTPEEMTEALRGDWQPEHLFVLRQARATYDWVQAQITSCDSEIEKALQEVRANPAVVIEEQRPPNPEGTVRTKKKKKTRGNAPKKDFGAELIRICGIDLTKVVGLNLLSVLMLISEFGVDMSHWRNAKAFVSWLGLCPGSKISGGKRLSSRTRGVKSRPSILLRSLAPSIGRTDTWLGAFHRRMITRLGPAGANTATARKLATILYHLLKYKEDYIDVDQLLYQERYQRCRLNRLQKQAKELGFELIKVQKVA